MKDGFSASDGCNDPKLASDCADLKSQRNNVDSSRNLAVGAFVVGGVAALAAGYFYWDALSHSSAQDAQRQRALFGRWTPSLELGRERAHDAASIGSVKLSVSGNF